MKTLEEVIKALELCTGGYCSDSDGDCPYIESNNDCDTRKRKLDALHYLKEYLEYKNGIKFAAKEYHEHLVSYGLQYNPPITWEELKGMEGRPVWIEEDYGYKHWEIIDGVHDEDVSFEAEYSFSKDTYGKEWKAYRYERK